MQVNLQNFRDNSVLFTLDNVTATGYKIKNEQIKEIPLQVLTNRDYDTKIANKQAWNNFFVGLSEGLAAYNAGKSSSSTSYSGNSYTTASAYGYLGNTYGSANAYGSAYTTTYGRTYTQNYNGYAAYAAQQKANENYAAYANNQYQIREQLNEGYIKSNTIRSKVEISGYFLIDYKKVDHLKVVFTIDGEPFEFVW